MDRTIYVSESNKCSETNNNSVSRIKEFDSNIKKTKKSLTPDENNLENLVTPLSKVHDSEVDYNWRWNDRTDPNDPNRHIIGTNTYISLKLEKQAEKRNKNLQKPEIKELCQDSASELDFLCTSDQSRQAKEVFDSGEIGELNKEYETNAVRRYGSVLLRVSTGKPVAWSKTENKWIDIEVKDKRELKKLRQLIQRSDVQKELY